ncbi:MAG TPA: NAD(+)/NADH kinase [Candidatus Acidoferrales bacterium]|nr:NAD(+)/NADH kinase [Candidatus Acidoferrales bacterium]
MTKVGFLIHPQVEREVPHLRQAEGWLREHGITCWVASRETPGEVARTSLLVTLGGDGTFLYGARLAAPRGIPLLGVNLGRLGFLTELESEDLTKGLERFFAGDYQLEQRALLRASAIRQGRRVSSLGLNEAALRGEAGKMVRLEIDVDGHDVGVIDADGAVIATATGSTAYALAMGGPILEPELRDLVLVPTNPFALTVRPIVFHPPRVLTLKLLRGDGHLTVDGYWNRRVLAGDLISVGGYARRLKAVRFGPPEAFFRRLQEKLGWGRPLVPLK